MGSVGTTAPSGHNHSVVAATHVRAISNKICWRVVLGQLAAVKDGDAVICKRPVEYQAGATRSLQCASSSCMHGYDGRRGRTVNDRIEPVGDGKDRAGLERVANHCLDLSISLDVDARRAVTLSFIKYQIEAQRQQVGQVGS